MLSEKKFQKYWVGTINMDSKTITLVSKHDIHQVDTES